MLIRDIDSAPVKDHDINIFALPADNSPYNGLDFSKTHLPLWAYMIPSLRF